MWLDEFSMDRDTFNANLFLVQFLQQQTIRTKYFSRPLKNN